MTESELAAPFPPAYFDVVFVVPRPPAEWPSTFAIVTAHNPEGLLSPDQANNQYERALDDYLHAEGIESFAVVGASRDLTHHESGRGFAANDVVLAAAISAKFRQAAFYWIEDGVVFVCNDASGKGWKVAGWQERVLRSR